MASLNFPANPADGDYYEGFSYDSTIGVWKRVGGSGAASMTVSETPPTQGLTSGAMWLDSVTGNTYIYYEDADNSQWVQSAGVDLIASRGSDFTVQTTAPANPVDGDIWYDPTEGFTYIYYEDQDSSQWVQFGLNRNGPPGTDGADGVNGVGVPAGGTTGQTLVKSSDTDYAVEWGAAAGGGAGDFLEATSDTISLDFSDTNSFIKRSVAGDVTITANNYVAGASKKVYLAGDSVKRSLSFPVEWNFTNTLAPTDIGSNDTNILQLDCFGNTASDVVAQWIGPYAFEPIVATGGQVSELTLGQTTYKLHIFTTTENFVVSNAGSPSEVEYLVVAGGGGAGSNNYHAGGGGAGGMLTGSTLITAASYPVVIGAGGNGPSGSSGIKGSNGSNSSFSSFIAVGGGGGAVYQNGNGLSGGSGGGAGGESGVSYSGGSGTIGQGNAGGNTTTNQGGGGGGAGEPGETSATSNGGDGLSSSITGSPVYYAGGGGGSRYSSGTSTGGLGGGGNGSSGNGQSGNPNTGGGGGAGERAGTITGSGGSGIVIIRYPITDPN